MSGLETIAKFGNISDEQRWNANRYDFPWLAELDEHDRDLIKLLDCLRDGEYSGQASAVQFYDLLFQERDAGYPRELLYDWSPLLSYVNIIVYEEMRHGLTLGLLYDYVTTGRTDYIAQSSVRDFGARYVWCYEKRRYWNLYSYALAHLFAEVINTELYRDVVSTVHHPELKAALANIRNDEARHIAAWSALIRDLINADPAHKVRALESLERGLTHHNAMVHETYFEGLNKMLPLFIPAHGSKLSAIQRISHHKHRVLDDLFGNDNPYTETDVLNIHMRYLSLASGQTRAEYSETSPGNIAFV